MFLREIGSTDERFKQLRFHDGLNLIVANRTEFSEQGDSRNGTGKSSFVRILRYLFGGNLPKDFKTPALTNHKFWATVSFDDVNEVKVTRSVSPTTRVFVQGLTGKADARDMHVDDWRVSLGSRAFDLNPEDDRPTPGQLWGQLVRTDFSSPVKTHSTETDWETGTRLGHFFGLNVSELNGAGDVNRIEKQRTALKAAIKEGAISHLSLDEAGIRSRLAASRRASERLRLDLQDFRVDDQYSEHQRSADILSATIRDLNDEALSLDRRRREILDVVGLELTTSRPDWTHRLADLYAEVGIALPEAVTRRFDEVERFHASIVQNRGTYLRDELQNAEDRLNTIQNVRSELDDQRAGLLRLLRDAVALDTFLEAQQTLAGIDAEVADLTRRLESAVSINSMDSNVKLTTAAALKSVRGEVERTGRLLERPISLFNELGAEIYRDHSAQLLVSVGSKGALKVEPRIDGDASDGIQGVATFLLDFVSLIAGIEAGRTPRLLVHDSHLFDAVDHRQVASCLNIGARLAEQHGFQYVVTMNSDFLASVESEGAFDRTDYVMGVELTDDDETGGLFGFRFSDREKERALQSVK
jgi:uncharacterized protein YydD (DUF2326 family)